MENKVMGKIVILNWEPLSLTHSFCSYRPVQSMQELLFGALPSVLLIVLVITSRYSSFTVIYYILCETE